MMKSDFAPESHTLRLGEELVPASLCCLRHVIYNAATKALRIRSGPAPPLPASSIRR